MRAIASGKKMQPPISADKNQYNCICAIFKSKKAKFFKTIACMHVILMYIIECKQKNR